MTTITQEKFDEVFSNFWHGYKDEIKAKLGQLGITIKPPVRVPKPGEIWVNPYGQGKKCSSNYILIGNTSNGELGYIYLGDTSGGVAAGSYLHLCNYYESERWEFVAPNIAKAMEYFARQVGGNV